MPNYDHRRRSARRQLLAHRRHRCVRSHLAAAVRSRSARRSQTRRAGAFTVSAIILSALLLVLARSPLHQKAPVATGVDVARLRTEIARLNSEAEFHQSVARALEQAISTARRPQYPPRPASFDPMTKLQEQREITAALLVHQATKLSLQPRTKDDARQVLTRAATLFPDTTAGRHAEVALRHGV